MHTLIIAPHADDEVLGCGGYMARCQMRGDCVWLTVVALGGERAPGQAEDFTVRQRELAQASQLLGVERVDVLFPGYNMRLDTLPTVELVSKLDAILALANFDAVYLPYAAVNHDHMTVYRAALAALRPATGRPQPRLVAAYEYAQIGWQFDVVPGGQYLIDITPWLERKLAALACYTSQVRPYPHPCSSEAIRTLAQFRGLAMGTRYAEMFYALRMVSP